jgi:hypothetical protein
MAKRIKLRLDDSLRKKYNAIMEKEAFTKYIQQKLCDLAGIDCSIKQSNHRGRQGLKSSETTIYLNDDASLALDLLKEKTGGFVFSKFMRQEIEKRYNELYEK